MKSARFYLASFLFLTIFVGLLWVRPALADSGVDATPIEEATPDDLSVLQDATEKYFDAVGTYRDLERQFLIAREQYYQLNTLSAQDEAIRRGQELLRARALALQTYFRYLNVVVMRTRGIDLDDKNDVLAQLEEADRSLQAYIEGIRALDTREKVDRHFVTLNSLKGSFYHTAYSALATMKMGEIQTAIDSSGLLASDLKAIIEVSKLSAAEKAVRLRGLEEVDRLLQRAKNNLTTQRQQYLRNSSSNNYNESAYSQFQSEIDFSYTQLRQAVSFLREVSKDL